jgi:hypothetical protein
MIRPTTTSTMPPWLAVAPGATPFTAAVAGVAPFGAAVAGGAPAGSQLRAAHEHPGAPSRHAHPTPPPAATTADWLPDPATGDGPAPSATRSVAQPGHRPTAAPPHTRLGAAMASLRHATAERLLKLNTEHAEQAWQRRRRDPINPNAVVLLYTEPDGNALRVAVRWFLAADETDLARLLYAWHPVVAAQLADGADPRTELTHWADPITTQPVDYLGVAVSSLNTATGSWAQVRRTARNELDFPGRCLAEFIDGSRLQLDRLAVADFAAIHLWCTHRLTGHPPRPWTVRDLHQPAGQDNDTHHAWQWLHHLNHLIAAGPHAHR